MLRKLAEHGRYWNQVAGNKRCCGVLAYEGDRELSTKAPAMIGAIAGDAGKGAAAGAVVGTMRRGRQQRQANAASKQQAAQSAASGMRQQYQQTLAAYNGQLDTFKRGFTACMDSRSYAVK